MIATADQLPRDDAAERYVLGCLAAYPDRAGEVLPLLSAQDFFDPLHQRIYAAFSRQYAAGGIDPGLAGRETDSAGYLLELAQNVATAVHVPHEAGKIVEARRKRQLLDIVASAGSAAKNGHSAEDVLRLLRGDLEDVERETQSDIALPTISTVEASMIDWAWPGYLARGAFTLLDGDPELGKSQITCDVTGRWTRPRPFPYAVGDDFREPGNVLMIASEDNNSTTTRPRLEAVNANLDRVFYWPEDIDPITLPDGAERLAAAIKRHDITLVILDPIGAYLHESINANRDADVRRALRPLVALAQETNVAVLAVRHLNKDENKSALYRGGGSIAFTAAARVAWAVGADPHDPTRRVLCVLKSNIGRKPPALSYSIEGVDGTSRIRWEGESTYTANDILTRKQRRGGKSEDAEALLRKLLADGPLPEPDVWEAVHAAGIRDWTYKQARKRLKIQSTKGGFGEGWLLSLPEEDGFGQEGEEDDESC